jgi:hypothetical protein
MRRNLFVLDTVVMFAYLLWWIGFHAVSVSNSKLSPIGFYALYGVLTLPLVSVAIPFWTKSKGSSVSLRWLVGALNAIMMTLIGYLLLWFVLAHTSADLRTTQYNKSRVARIDGFMLMSGGVPLH